MLAIITKILVVLCVVESVHGEKTIPLFTRLFASVKGSTTCPQGYEPITSTWQACKAATKWHGEEKGKILFVDGKSPEKAAYPPGCYWQYNNGKSHSMLCHLKKGWIYFEKNAANNTTWQHYFLLHMLPIIKFPHSLVFIFDL